MFLMSLWSFNRWSKLLKEAFTCRLFLTWVILLINCTLRKCKQGVTEKGNSCVTSLTHGCSVLLCAFRCAVHLDDLIFNGNLVQLLPKCCQGTRWVSKSQVCVSPVQRTPTNGIFRLWTLCSHHHTACPVSYCGDTT